MSLEKNLSQLKKLDRLRPNKDWETTTKYDLLSEIHSQNRLRKAQQLSTAERFDLLMMKIIRRLMPSVTKVVAGFLIVFLGTGTGFVAQASVPGQSLWPIKRSMERAELTLTFNPIKETEVHIKHINKRLNEIDKIVENTRKDDKPEKVAKQGKAIKQAVQYLGKDAAAVDSTLKVVKEEKKPLEVVELAKKVKEANKETKKKVVALEEQVANTVDGVIEKALDDVREISAEVDQVVVDLALELHEEVIIAQEVKKAERELGSDLTDQEKIDEDIIDDAEIEAVRVAVVEMITDDINELSDEIQATKVKIGVVDKQDLDDLVVEKREQEMILTGENKNIFAEGDVKEIKNQPGEAELSLGEAKVLLEEGSVKGAVEKLSETKKIQHKTETVLKEIEKSNKAQEANNAEVDNTDNTIDEPIENNTQSAEVTSEESIEAAAIEPEESDLEEVN